MPAELSSGMPGNIGDAKLDDPKIELHTESQNCQICFKGRRLTKSLDLQFFEDREDG